MNKRCVVSVTGLMLAVGAGADVITVDDDGPADFDDIQAAVDFASTGDEIVVSPGVYTSGQAGHVVDLKGKAIALRSVDGPGVTIIDGEEARRGIACFNGEMASTLIEGFTIRNGFGVAYDYDGNDALAWWESSGGGMYNGGSSPTVADCTFENNSAGGTNVSSGGGMINFQGSSPTLIDCTLTNNSATDSGGGMYNRYESNPTLANCTFEKNSAVNSGGGMYNATYSSPTLENCTFENNSASLGTSGSGGGMVNLSYSHPTLENCTFTGNTSPNYGGGMTNSDSNPTIENCTFTGNACPGYGGGIFNSNSNPALTDTLVCGNTPDQINGPWTDNGGNTVVDECPDAPCLADLNHDGIVDGTDLSLVLGQWGPCTDPSECPWDINGNGIVDGTDLSLVLGAWGPCP